MNYTNKEWIELSSRCAPLIAPIWIVWSILAIELTLFWKGATGIYDISSTGQLIPLVICILTLVGLVQVIVTVYLRENYVRKSIPFGMINTNGKVATFTMS